MPHDVGTILAENTDSLEKEKASACTGGVERDVHTGNAEEHLNQLGVRSTILNRNRPCGWSPPPERKDEPMENSHLTELSVYASGVQPVVFSGGKRINRHHRIPVRALVEVATGGTP